MEKPVLNITTTHSSRRRSVSYTAINAHVGMCEKKIDQHGEKPPTKWRVKNKQHFVFLPLFAWSIPSLLVKSINCKITTFCHPILSTVSSAAIIQFPILTLCRCQFSSVNKQPYYFFKMTLEPYVDNHRASAAFYQK